MAAEEARKLFVAGLPDTYTEDVLRQMFEETGGKVLEVSLPKDRATGRPRGFGFVTLSTAAEAQIALDSLHGSLHAGRAISVRPFQAEPPKRDALGGPPPRGDRPGGGYGGGGERPAGGPGGGGGGGGSAPDRTIYVGNLPYDATEEEVDTLFRERGVGPIQRVSLPIDESGRRRGFGFVSMVTAESANAAIESLKGADLRGRPLFVNLAHPRGSGGPGGGAPREGGPPRYGSTGGPSPGGYAGGGGGGGGGGYSGAGAGGGGGGGYSGGGSTGPGPGAGGAGAAGRKKTDWTKKKQGEGERRSKSLDRERGGGGRVDRDDWDD